MFKMNNTKKNIAFYIYKINTDGVSKSLETIINNLDIRKYNIELVVLVKSEFTINTSVKTIYLYSSDEAFLFRSIDDDNLTYNNKFDILISYSCIITANYISRVSGNIKKYAFIHGDFNKIHKSYTKSYLLDVYSSMDKIIAVSDFVKETIQNYMGDFFYNKILVIYNPIDKEKILKLSKMNFNKNQFTLLTIGRLSDDKGIKEIIEVHKRLIDNNIYNELIILGEGEERENYEKLIDDFKVSKTCELKGYVKNPYIYIYNCDLFVLFSKSEGLPLVIMEAMVLRKPIIASNVGGCTELLEENLGKLIENNKEELYENVKDMIENKSNREQYERILSGIKCFKFEKKEVILQIEKILDN